MIGIAASKLRWLVVLLGLALLPACDEQKAADDEISMPQPTEPARLVAAQDIIASAQVSTLDPGIMSGAEIRKAIGEGRFCAFRYTSTGRPVAAVSAEADDGVTQGVIKLNGRLIKLRTEATGRDDAPSSDFSLQAGPIRLVVTPDKAVAAAPGQREANMVFVVGNELKVGYRGYLSCGA